MVDTHSTRVGHLDINTNRWRASKYPRWDADSGHFGADLDFRPETKFALLVPFYNFGLSVMVIRITD